MNRTHILIGMFDERGYNGCTPNQTAGSVFRQNFEITLVYGFRILLTG